MPQPQRSRDRHRGYERDRPATRDRDKERQREREKEKDVDRRRRSQQRRRRRDDYEEVDVGDGDEGHDEGDSDDVFDDDRQRAARRQQKQSSRSRTRERRYDPSDDDDDDEGHNQRRKDEDVIFVGSKRPGFSRPPAPGAAATPVRESPRAGTADKHKAKESPATSPIKKRDRERDREGRRRRRDSTADEGSPTKPAKLRDRRANNRESDQARGGAMKSGGEEREGEVEGEGGGKRSKRREQKNKDKSKHASADSANSATQLLNADTLARLNARNQKTAAKEDKEAKQEKERARLEQERKRKSKGGVGIGGGIFGGKLRGRESSVEREKKSPKKRLVSGAALEEGRSPDLKVRGGRRNAKNEKWRKGGSGDDDEGDSSGGSKWSRKKKICIGVAVLALLLVIVIPVAVVVSKKGDDSDGDDGGADAPSNDELNDLDPNSIPSNAKGTYYDPFSWYDTADFNVTYTEEKIGGLPIMGLNSTWDDSAQANDNVPALNEEFPYGKQPIRGVNVGGWLVIEPFITPSFFEEYSDDVIDDWTLAERMGATAKDEYEKHYATFIDETSFKEIRDAGFDHVRIPYGYWAVTTYDDDPYVPMVSWRYLLRAIEYCRQYGLRVSLDLHAAPGSQNGWNHSGHSSKINWINGTDGDLNAQRTLDIHDQLSQFFAQPRYKNVVTMYGLVNEPMMLRMEIEPVIDWTTKAAEIITGNGMDQYIVFGDGFLKLSKWSTMLQDTGSNLVLDTHQYTIFNQDLIKMTHMEKLELVCDKWTELISDSNSGGDAGWGPTICGEWSQADTDCAKFLNNVGAGASWTGTMNDPNGRTDVVLEPQCPTEAGDNAGSGKPCSCAPANAYPSDYSESYKTFLQTYAEAQISAFETGWGWFYWTWDTESAVQWSWRKGLAAGILPEKAYGPAFKCGDSYPDLSSLPEHY